MSVKNKVLKQYEKTLIEDYYDVRAKLILEPLYESFQKWKKGELEHNELMELIHKVHKENQQLYSLFSQSREFLITCIEADEEWYQAWLKKNPPPERGE